MKKLLEFILPEKWRSRGAPRVEVNDAVLGRLTESDPVYRALMDHAYVQFENECLAALQPGITPDQRSYLAGRASAMAAHITTVESVRVRAREEEEKSRVQSPRSKV